MWGDIAENAVFIFPGVARRLGAPRSATETPWLVRQSPPKNHHNTLLRDSGPGLSFTNKDSEKSKALNRQRDRKSRERVTFKHGGREARPGPPPAAQTPWMVEAWPPLHSPASINLDDLLSQTTRPRTRPRGSPCASFLQMPIPGSFSSGEF